jgi:1,4-dihydroxy-2-naphthoate octaprenyltransferase
MRIPFLQASILPVVLGSALAYRDGRFSWELLWLMLAAMAAINIGTNLTNDYYDHRSGADERNRHPTRFSGGSRVIQQGLLPPKAILTAGLISYGLAVALGLLLVWRTRLELLWFGVPGVVLSFFYTAAPLRLGYRGWGELLAGILLGPGAVMGAYFVHTGAVTTPAFALSLPMGFLVSGILYINQFPDAESDAAAGKLHLVARIGTDRAVGGYLVIMTAAFMSIPLSVAFGMLPPWTLLALLSLPAAVRAIWMLGRWYDQPARLVPAMGLTVGTHLAVGLLLWMGLIVG